MEYGGGYIAQALANEGTEAMFGIVGGSDNLLADAMKLGISAITVRHEQAATFAADGYARAARRPGIAFTSGVNGTMNAATGMYHAQGANSPVVLLATSTPLGGDGLAPVQSGGGTAVITSVMEQACKFSMRLTDTRVLSYWVREALLRSVAGTPGPVSLELPRNINLARGDVPQLHYVQDSNRVAALPRTAGDADAVRDVVDRIMAAERPVIINGDSIYWDDASSELKELIELLQVPTCGRRMGRGAIPETHPLSFTPTLRRGFLADADLIVLVGHQVGAMDEYFAEPAWNHDCSWIQIQDNAANIWYGIPTDSVVLGSPKLVLRQMVEYAMEATAERPVDHSAWTGALQTAIAKRRASVLKTAQSDRTNAKIHPNVLCQDLSELMDDSSTLILDSFAASTHMTDKFLVKYPGQILDAGNYQTLGHSIGMAIGAQVARPGKQVVSLIGDGGFGIGGMDMETMVRYDLPAVVVLFNNSSWGGRAWAHDMYYPGRKGTGDLTDVRYDEMMRAVGCHTEFVEAQEDIKPALERAFESGKPALVNVVGDTETLNGVRMFANLLDVWTRDGWDELSDEAHQELRAMPKSVFERVGRHMRETGDVRVTTEDVVNYVEPTFARTDPS